MYRPIDENITTLTELEIWSLQFILIMWFFWWGKWCILCWNRSWIHAKNSGLICVVFITMKPPQIEVVLRLRRNTLAAGRRLLIERIGLLRSVWGNDFQVSIDYQLTLDAEKIQWSALYWTFWALFVVLSNAVKTRHLKHPKTKCIKIQLRVYQYIFR